MKRFISLMLCFALLFVMTACGSDKKKGSTDSEVNGTTNQQQETDNSTEEIVPNGDSQGVMSGNQQSSAIDDQQNATNSNQQTTNSNVQSATSSNSQVVSESQQQNTTSNQQSASGNQQNVVNSNQQSSSSAQQNTISSNQQSTTNSDKESGKNVFEVKAAPKVTNFSNSGNVIICWGDSITQGMAMAEGFTYPQHLQGSIGSQYRVINAGVPGETSEAILSRANAVEICFTGDVTFAKGEKQYAMNRNMFKLVGADKPLTYKGFGNQLRLSNVIIDGKKYTIEYKKGATYDDGTYCLTRSDVSSALTIPAGTKVTFDYTGQYTNVYCNIIYIGGNDGEQTAEQIINKYKKLTALNDRYIVIVPHFSNDYSKEFAEAFGDKALNIRGYFTSKAHEDYGVELTGLDGYCIRKNLVPTRYNYKNQKNEVHLNELGYKVLADQVYKKGQELGYWK